MVKEHWEYKNSWWAWVSVYRYPMLPLVMWTPQYDSTWKIQELCWMHTCMNTCNFSCLKIISKFQEGIEPKTSITLVGCWPMPAVLGGHLMIDHTIFKLFDLKDFWFYPQIYLKVFPIHYSFIALSNFLPLVAVNRVYSGGWQLKWSWSCARRLLVVHNPSQDLKFPPLVMTTQDLCPWGIFYHLNSIHFEMSWMSIIFCLCLFLSHKLLGMFSLLKAWGGTRVFADIVSSSDP